MKRVFISPSNQSNNLYAYGNTNEAKQMEALATLLQFELTNQNIYSYIAPHNINIDQRGYYANAGNYDCYISLHTNASGNGSVRGCEAFYKPSSAASIHLCKVVYETLLEDHPELYSRGMKDGMVAAKGYPLAEIRIPNMANTLVEIEFHDNRDGAEWIIDHLSSISVSIAKGVCLFLGKEWDNNVERREVEFYKTLNDIPEVYRPSIKELVDNGTIAGKGGDILDLSEIECRLYTILNRKGVL